MWFTPPVISVHGLEFRFAWLALAGPLLGGCASIETVAPPVTPVMVAALPGASTTLLEEGRRIFTRACTSCHSAEPVERYSIEAWREIVIDMSERTKLDASEKSALLAYLAAAKHVGVHPAPNRKS
jgi:uncharacterized membrane protein